MIRHNRHKFKKAILACGAESKGSFSLAKERNLFISRDFENLSDYNNLSRYEKSVRRNLTRFNISPKIIACDMHPDYNSTFFAEELKAKNARLIKVQHHHAHIASCMLDNGLEGRVIGVAFDGTGYGSDGNMWGGEFLVSSFKDFKRAAYLKYLPMPGGDKAITEPWRMAAVYLWDTFGDGFLKLGIPFTKRIKGKDWQLLRHMIDRRMNSPLTSSIGRLFDAVASIIICITKIDFEAEAAIRLQKLAQSAKGERGIYKNDSIEKKDTFIIDLKEVIREIVKDIKEAKDKAVIAAKFHNTVASIISGTCARLRRLNRINRVVLSGGVFQNELLVEETLEILKKLNFDVYTHNFFSTSDFGIPAGQAAVANARC